MSIYIDELGYNSNARDEVQMINTKLAILYLELDIILCCNSVLISTEFVLGLFVFSIGGKLTELQLLTCPHLSAAAILTVAVTSFCRLITAYFWFACILCIMVSLT